MLPTVAIVPGVCSLPVAATIPLCRPSRYGRMLSNRTSSISRGGAARCRCHPIRSSLHENETNSEPRGPASEAESSTSSTTIPVEVVGEQNKTPLAKGQDEGMHPPRVVSEGEGDGGGFVGGGRFGDLSLLQTRRVWLGTSVGLLAALGGNLGGLTSSIFNLSPQVSRRVRADLLFPVKGFKRCLEASQGFEFIYPMSWVGDQRLLYRAVERAERERSLDLPPIQRRDAPRRASSGDPVVAFGPPGTDGELNVSVVVAPVYAGFTLQKIGRPQEAGELILKQFIAPDGSKKVATLLTAQQRTVEDQLYYYLEYSVKGPTFFRHNMSVYTTSSGLLYSLNAQAAESDWVSVQADFGEIANSFKLLR